MLTNFDDFTENWPHLYLLNYQFLWKFTGILFCSESVFNHKKKIYISSMLTNLQSEFFFKKEGIFYQLFFSVNIDRIYLFYHFLWLKTDSKQISIIVNWSRRFFDNAMVSKWVVPGAHSFFFIIYIIKKWFWTKKYSCKFSQKSIVQKIQIGSNRFFSYGDEFIYMNNFLTINFYKNLQEYFFVQN